MTESVIYKTRPDALMPRDSSSIARRRNEDADERVRRPLGLAPILEDAEPEPDETDYGLLPDRAATMRDFDALAETTGEILASEVGKLRKHFEAEMADARKEITELRITVAELKGAQLERQRATILRP
jgi:hypothetical protein